MSDHAEWWGDVTMRGFVSPEMVASAIAAEIGASQQERWFPISEVVGIEQMGPGGDLSSFITRFYVGCIDPDAMDDLGVMETALRAVAPLVYPFDDEYVYCLLPGCPADGYIYRFVAEGVERTDAAFSPIEPRQWKRVEVS